MKKLLKYLKGYEKECVLGPLFKLLEATFELLVPLVVASIVDKGIGSGDRGYIVKMCAVMIGLGVVGLASSVTAQYFSAVAAVGFSTRLRHTVLEHILNLSYSQVDKLGASTMITRMTSDINQVQNGVNLTLRLLLRSPFVVFGAMVMAFTIDFQAALVFAGVIPVLCIIVFGIMLITMPMYRRVQASLDSVTSASRQNLTGVRVLRAFCKEDAEVTSFEEKTEDMTRKQLSAGRISALMNPVTYVVINLAVVLLVHVGALKVESGVLTQGLVIALYNYMSQILVELIKMANLIITITKAVACGNRVASVLDLEPGQENGTRTAADLKGQVEFQDVTARYDGAGNPSLEHITFTARPGQTIGIIGGTGSAKSTLVNLIARLYDATEGTVRVGGVDVRDYDLDALRHQVAMVLQKNVLFSGTIAENLRWGDPNATDEEVREAAHLACADEFVDGFPKGYDTWIEQGGSNVSGGQKQRLCIARALLRRPKILILDDSTSAVDTKTDAKIRAGLASYLPNTTKLIIAQRISSVQDADRIIVMEGGRIAQIGNHDELLKTSEIYRETFTSQNKMSAEGEGAVEADTEASATQAQTQEGGEAHE